MAFLRFGMIFCALFVFQCQANVLASQPEPFGDEMVDLVKRVVDEVVTISYMYLRALEAWFFYMATYTEEAQASRDRQIENLIDHIESFMNRILDGIKPDLDSDAVVVLDCVQQQGESIKQLPITFLDSVSTCLQVDAVKVYSDADVVLSSLKVSMSQIEEITNTLNTCDDILCLKREIIQIMDVLKDVPDKIHDDTTKLIDDGKIALEVAEGCIRSDFPALQDGIKMIFNNFTSCIRS